MKARALVGVAALGAIALSAGALPAASSNPPIAIDVTPRTCVAPCNVRLLVRIEPNQANRRVTINAESDGFGRSTSRTMDGERSAAVYELLLQNLEAGVYDVQVVVDRAAESATRRTSQFSVHGEQSEDERRAEREDRGRPPTRQPGR